MIRRGRALCLPLLLRGAGRKEQRRWSRFHLGSCDLSVVGLGARCRVVRLCADVFVIDRTEHAVGGMLMCPVKLLVQQ